MEKCELLATNEEKKEFESKIKEINEQIESFKNPKTKQMIEESIAMYGREEELKSCFLKIDHSVKNKLNTYILITGYYGSGKSLFIRCLMKKYLDEKIQNNSNNNKFKNIFYTLQLPNTLFDPFNGFRKIMKEIYRILVDTYSRNLYFLTKNF